MKAFNPTDKLMVELDAQTWNVVLDQLADGRYRVVAPIIASLGGQLEAQAAQPATDNVVPMGAAE